MSTPVVLVVQAVDPLGSEGLAGDLRVLADLECAARVAVTAVALPPPRLRHRIPDDVVEAQIRGVYSERPPAVVRTGGFAEPAQVERVAHWLGDLGAATLVVGYEPAGRKPEARRTLAAALGAHLVPLARVVVVRAALAEDWGAGEVEDLDTARVAAAAIRAGGAAAVAITGVFSGGRVLDVLVDRERTAVHDTPRIAAARVEGLAVAHASALAAHLARGLPLERAAGAAQRYVASRLANAR